ncbi:S24 family peptidase [Deinococcus alpinitundrae]|uniref:S24 family peptidase n=1 Tax=Deinococcus alpinitundrae TaxID=468913 RepID=UPI001ED93BF2|nr:S24 family peptidase [Deinococcus alpinitundrae]
MQQMHTEYQQQPVYKLNGLIQDDATPFEYAWLPPGRGDDPKFTKALLIEDTDMERMGRSLHPDDIVFVRTDKTTPVPDALYAIVHESKVMIRRYVETPIGAAFTADNPALSGQLISPSKVTIVGHVYRVFSDFNNYGN